MPTKIHPSAIVDPGAELGENVEVGALTVIEADVKIGDASKIGPHVTLQSGVRLGASNRVYAHAAVGGDPQDLKYAGEKSYLEIGKDNMIREFVTLNRGTAEGGGVTRIGDDNLFMAYSHVAHDCHFGSHIVVANSVAIAGHCVIEDYVVIGGLTGLHQFARIGEGCMAGAAGRFSTDLLPFSTTAGNDEIVVYGLNKIGLKRRGLSNEDFHSIEQAMKLYIDPALNHSDALKALEAYPKQTREVKHLIDFIKTSTRGVYR
jgi:UDP-N-acetylglucosamine acyltransferase